MIVPVEESDLVGRVAATTGLSQGDAARVVADVVAFYAESTNDYVRRRHSELQRDGLKNPQIFARLQRELVGRVVAPPPLSERQLRRIVYG